MTFPFLNLGLGFIIGLSLGLLGGGGSILTVPALVYLVGQTPQVAVTTSLAIVGANSALGAIFHKSQGSFNGRIALWFGGIGMLVAYLASGLSHYFSPHLLMVLFALLMLLVAGSMLRPRPETGKETDAKPRLWVTLVAGAGVGLLTGVLGVGGGFLIVPALVLFVGLPMSQAVGTSLVIIASNSLAGLLGHLHGSSLDFPLLAIFVIAGLGGVLLGTRLTHVLPSRLLRLAFALFVTCLAFFLLADNLPHIF